jgi:pyruvate/2-oxoglutarate dehydrogenase complex dihydrolipoamide acyltransferase (E2) component
MSDDRVAVTADAVWPDEADAEEAVVLTWYATEGRAVSEGQRVCEIQVEKVDVDVLAPADGTLAEVARDADDAFERGDVLAWIDPG